MNFKKIISAITTVALGAAVFTGCGGNYDYVVKVDDTNIGGGLYMMAQVSAYNEAQSKITDDTEVLKATIEEIPASEWVYNKTIETLKNYIWVQKECAKNGITISEEDKATIASNVSYYWPYMGSYYTENGISQQTYVDFQVYIQMRNLLFDSIYGDKGEKAVADDDVKAFALENYTLFKGFHIAKVTEEGAPLKDDILPLMEPIAQQALADLKAGKAMDETAVKYMSQVGEIVGSKTDFSDSSKYIMSNYIKKDETNQYPKEFIDSLFSMKIGESNVTEFDSFYMVYTKIANFENDEVFKENKGAFVSVMKNDEFDAYTKEEAATLEVVTDAKAVKYYSPSKIKAN